MENQQIHFARKPSILAGGRKAAFNVPADLVRLLNPHQVYQITIRPIGTLTYNGATAFAKGGGVIG